MDTNTFNEFNELRKLLAQRFHELIGLVGNHIFHGKINLENENMIKEINRQDLMEPEKNILKNLHFYSTNLMASRFLLGVLGRFKAGKSTVLNALAQENISPMDTRISTGVLNFTYKKDPEQCIVVYDNGYKQSIDPEEKTKYIDCRYNPDNEKGVHSVRHGSPTLDLQKEIVFVDTPGLEAVNSVHEKITLDFTAQCHAAIIVSTFPPFGETELRFYERTKDVIPNIFLIQNLPEDKLKDWVILEAQTLENLNKLGFYQVDKGYGNKTAREILQKIADDRDERAIEKYKDVHKIHIFSVNALAAYRYVVGANKSVEELEKSRFVPFKEVLYSFLAKNKGRKLIETYLAKGKVVLDELIAMVNSKLEILQNSLEEIEKKIQDQKERKEKIDSMVDLITDRTSLKVLESYKSLKNQIMEKDLGEVISSLNNEFGSLNVFRLRKTQLKRIKTKINEFNRLFSVRHVDFMTEVRKIVAEAEEKVSEALESQSVLAPVKVQHTYTSVNMMEISGAGYIDYGFEVVYRGGLAWLFGSLAGGAGIALLAPFVGPAMGTVIGAAVGVGVSFPCEKYFAPLLEMMKSLVGRIANKPAQKIFDNFRSNVREKLDEIESLIVDQMIKKFKQEVDKSTQEFFDFYRKILEDLKEKKEKGEEQQEFQKLTEIVQELNAFREKFEELEKKSQNLEEIKVNNVLKGIKGFIKKFT